MTEVNKHQEGNTYIKKSREIEQGISGTTNIYERPRNGARFVSTARSQSDSDKITKVLEKLNDCPYVMKIHHVENSKHHVDTLQKAKKEMYTLYYDLGDLHNVFIKRNDYEIEDIKLYDIIIQIIEGVKCMHTNSVCHLDLKLENIVIRYDKKDGKYKISIIDFDKSQICDENGICDLNKPIGTYDYLSDEMKFLNTIIFDLKKFPNDTLDVQIDGSPENYNLVYNFLTSIQHVKFNGKNVDKFALYKTITFINEYYLGNMHYDMYENLKPILDEFEKKLNIDAFLDAIKKLIAPVNTSGNSGIAPGIAPGNKLGGYKSIKHINKHRKQRKRTLKCKK